MPLHPPWLSPLWAELGALHAAATTGRTSNETLPDDFCNYREGRAHLANLETSHQLALFMRDGCPFGPRAVRHRY
jgi:hypothetical protein